MTDTPRRRRARPLDAWYGWIWIDDEGREGMLLANTEYGTHTFMLFPDLKQAEFYRPIAERCREKNPGMRVLLVRWAARETLEDLP